MLEDDDRPARVHLQSLVQCVFDDIPSRQPRLREVVEVGDELLARDLRGGSKLLLNDAIRYRLVRAAAVSLHYRLLGHLPLKLTS